jgi:hypothetical protein
MLQKAISGTKAEIYRSISTPIQSAWTKMTWASGCLSASVSDNFWLNVGNTYPLQVRKNGVLNCSGVGLFASSTADEINTSQIQVYLNGASTTIAAGSVTAVAQATVTGTQIVHAIVYSSTGLAKISGTSGVASATRGAAGGPPYITSGAILLGYVVRAKTGFTGVITAAEISTTSYDGREWANAGAPNFLLPPKGEIRYSRAMPLIHGTSGTPLAASLYFRGYSHAGNEIKVANAKNWSLGTTQNREESKNQNDPYAGNDGGVRSFSFSADTYIKTADHAIFNQNIDSDTDSDYYIKAYIDQNTVVYYAFQCGLDIDLTLPQSDKSSASLTGQVTGPVCRFTS